MQTLLDAIAATPDDDEPRQVYADWLDDQGRHDEAGRIRQQLALAQADEPDWDALVAAQCALPELTGAGWSGAISWWRGFPTELRIESHTRLDKLEVDLQLEPLDTLACADHAPSRVPGARRLELANLPAGLPSRIDPRVQEIEALWLEREAIPELAELPELQRLVLPYDVETDTLQALERLNVAIGVSVQEPCWREVMALPRLERLRYTSLISRDELMQLADKPLRRLDLRVDGLEPGEFRDVFPDLPSLERLHLSYCSALEDADLERIVQAAPRLQTLSLTQLGRSCSADGLACLARLEGLRLSEWPAGGLAALAETGPRLRALNVAQLDVDDVRALATIPSLESLALGRACPALSQLTSLRAFRGDINRTLPPNVEFLATYDGNDLELLSRLPRLKWLDTPWSELDPADVFAALPELRFHGGPGWMAVARGQRSQQPDEDEILSSIRLPAWPGDALLEI